MCLISIAYIHVIFHLQVLSDLICDILKRIASHDFMESSILGTHVPIKRLLLHTKSYKRLRSSENLKLFMPHGSLILKKK